MTNTDFRTAEFYTQNRWPGPDAIVSKKWAKRLAPYIPVEAFTFLDAGCGSGQYTAGMLLEYPKSEATAVDISETSLRDAKQILRREGVQDRAEIVCQSFSEPLGWDDRFDFAIANGSIHHSPNPTRSLVNIAASLKPGGVLGCMMYGSRSNARRYEIKEALQLLAGTDIEEMYNLFSAYEKKYTSILDRTPRSLLRGARNWLGRRIARFSGQEQVWGYDAQADRRSIFIDGYSAPVDVAFSSPEIRQMLDTAGLELCEMFTMGKLDESLLPPEWVDAWQRLGKWEKVRVCELVAPIPMSFSFAARKALSI